MAKLGDVLLNVVYKEDRDSAAKTTDHPIENGLSIVDHVEKTPVKLKISGVCSGPDAMNRMLKLIRYKDAGALLTYVGRYYMHNMLIESIGETKDNTAAGTAYKFDISLKQVRVVARKTTQKKKTKTSKSKGKQQPKKQSPSKRTHVVQRGDTLGKISQKYYGSTRYIDKIYNQNKSVIGSNKNALKPGQKLIIP